MELHVCPSLSGSDPAIMVPVSIDYALKEPMVGTQLFPAAIYDDDITTAQVGWHWHEEFEMGFITDGAVTLQTGSQRYTLHQGDVYFINSGVLHAMKNATPEQKARFKVIVFHGSVVGGNENSVFHQKYVMPFLKSTQCRELVFFAGEARTAAMLAKLQSAWKTIDAEERGYELDARYMLSSFFALLLDDIDKNAAIYSDAARKRELRVKTMLDFLHSHYAENITLEQIANEAFISVSESLRCFKNVIGISPMQYLKNYRLQQAAYYMKGTDYSISKVCELCGFSDHSYFAKSFKAVYHCAPRDYRTAGRGV